jgi:hypothetical protein
VDAPPDDPPTPPGAAPAGSPLAPVGLEYFAAREPDRKRDRATVVWTFCLFLGWVPYLCGIVNVLVATQSYSPAVVGAHRGGAALFMGLGMLLSAAALAGFVRLRHWTGVVAGALLLAAQASVAGCLAVSNL